MAMGRRTYRALTVLATVLALLAPGRVVAAAFMGATLVAALELLGRMGVRPVPCAVLLLANALLIAAAGGRFVSMEAALLALVAVDGACLAGGVGAADDSMYNGALLIGAASLALLGLAAAQACELLFVPTTGMPRLQECIVLVAAQDFCAAAGGRWWPRGRLAPRISPNKTWSGAAFGLAGGLGAWLFLMSLHRTNFTAPQALTALVAGMFGDLLFSSVKRALHVKDFSRVLGFKGGMLDRIDSAIVSVVVAHGFA